MDKRIVMIEILPDFSGANLKFKYPRELSMETDDDESTHKNNKHTIEGAYVPHNDFVDAMKSIRKHGLKLLNIDLADQAKQLANWNVLKLSFSGSIEEKTARVKITMGVFNPDTKRISKITTGQFTMYPKADDAVKYADAEKLTAAIEKAVFEAFEYGFNAKYGETFEDDEEMHAQLVLFPSAEKEAA